MPSERDMKLTIKLIPTLETIKPHFSSVFLAGINLFPPVRYVNCSPVAGRFTPGAFTNQIQAAFREPRLLVISDPRSDPQPITEGSYANVPVIAFCNIDSPTKFIDIAIPCNNKSPHSIGELLILQAIRATIKHQL